MAHIKEKKLTKTCLSAGKINPTDRYFTQLPAIIYTPEIKDFFVIFVSFLLNIN